MKRLVITGGPQSGKTTILLRIAESFGAEVLIVPEVATPLLESFWHKFSRVGAQQAVWVETLQAAIFPTQLALRDIAEAEAQLLECRLIVFDRGTLDGAAYLGIDAAEFTSQFGYHLRAVLGYYDAVLHLETLAREQPEAFGSQTNAARYETVSEAVEVDKRLWEAYDSHSEHFRFRATADFEAKWREVRRAVEILLAS